MKPPICTLCLSRFTPKEGGLVKFSDYEPLPKGMVGHPKGYEWFCGKHYDDARALTHLTSKEAIEQLWINSGQSCG